MREMQAEGDDAKPLLMIRAYLLTGCRRNEILALKRKFIDHGENCLKFDDTKTGAQNRPIAHIAMDLLLKQLSKNSHHGDDWIFPADYGDGHFIGIRRVLVRVCKRAKVTGVTPHVLRHTFASVAAQLGYTELAIAGLLGHTVKGVTNQYSHLPFKFITSAADQVACKIRGLLDRQLSVSDTAETRNAGQHYTIEKTTPVTGC